MPTFRKEFMTKAESQKLHRKTLTDSFNKLDVLVPGKGNTPSAVMTLLGASSSSPELRALRALGRRGPWELRALGSAQQNQRIAPAMVDASERG